MGFDSRKGVAERGQAPCRKGPVPLSTPGPPLLADSPESLLCRNILLPQVLIVQGKNFILDKEERDGLKII